MKDYTFAHVLKERGFSEIPEESYKPCYDAKKIWVERYLEPTVVSANCGWESVKYVLMKIPCSDVAEYVVLASDKNEPKDGRYINITAYSKGAILCAVADNLW